MYTYNACTLTIHVHLQDASEILQSSSQWEGAATVRDDPTDNDAGKFGWLQHILQHNRMNRSSYAEPYSAGTVSETPVTFQQLS